VLGDDGLPAAHQSLVGQGISHFQHHDQSPSVSEHMPEQVVPQQVMPEHGTTRSAALLGPHHQAEQQPGSLEVLPQHVTTSPTPLLDSQMSSQSQQQQSSSPSDPKQHESLLTDQQRDPSHMPTQTSFSAAPLLELHGPAHSQHSYSDSQSVSQLNHEQHLPTAQLSSTPLLSPIERADPASAGQAVPSPSSSTPGTALVYSGKVPEQQLGDRSQPVQAIGAIANAPGALVTTLRSVVHAPKPVTEEEEKDEEAEREMSQRERALRSLSSKGIQLSHSASGKASGSHRRTQESGSETVGKQSLGPWQLRHHGGLINRASGRFAHDNPAAISRDNSSDSTVQEAVNGQIVSQRAGAVRALSSRFDLGANLRR